MTSVRYSCYVYKKGGAVDGKVSHVLAGGNKITKYYISIIKTTNKVESQVQRLGTENCITAELNLPLRYIEFHPSALLVLSASKQTVYTFKIKTIHTQSQNCLYFQHQNYLFILRVKAVCNFRVKAKTQICISLLFSFPFLFNICMCSHHVLGQSPPLHCK